MLIAPFTEAVLSGERGSVTLTLTLSTLTEESWQAAIVKIAPAHINIDLNFIVKLIIVHFFYIDFMPLAGSHQPLAVVVGHTPEEVFVHIAESVALAREDEHIETLVGTDEGIDDTDRVRRMHVVVDITVHEHEVSLQVGGNLRIGLD